MYTIQTPDNRIAALLRASVPAESWHLTTSHPMVRVASMSPYQPTRREFLIGAAGLLILAPYGCSGESGAGGETTSSAGGFPRTVEHAMGSTELPKMPERIVAVTRQMDLDTLLALDYPPVAAGQNGGDNDSRFIEYQQDVISEIGADIEGFRFRPEPDIEQIATFAPDLILGHEGWLELVYDQLSGVAPTVINYNDDAKWEENLRMVCACVGREAAVDRFLSDLEEKTEQTREAMDDRASTTVAFMSYIGDNEFYVSNDLTYTVQIMESVGLATPEELVTPPDADPGSDYQNVYSLETITKVGDADVWVVAEGDWETVRDEPVVQNLPVVQRGNVVTIPRDERSVWYYPTVLTRRRLLERLPERIPNV